LICHHICGKDLPQRKRILTLIGKIFTTAIPSHPMFSTLVKDLRISRRLTLRQFCQENGLDPSNWSKVERGVNPPPGDIRVLEALADFFELRDAQKQEFFDAAALGRRQIPADLAENEVFMKALPAFFRAARGHELTESEVAAFATEVMNLHRPDPSH
jgi:transcriptional regulator with XRE-family HTH domain